MSYDAFVADKTFNNFYRISRTSNKNYYCNTPISSISTILH